MRSLLKFNPLIQFLDSTKTYETDLVIKEDVAYYKQNDEYLSLTCYNCDKYFSENDVAKISNPDTAGRRYVSHEMCHKLFLKNNSKSLLYSLNFIENITPVFIRRR